MLDSAGDVIVKFDPLSVKGRRALGGTPVTIPFTAATPAGRQLGHKGLGGRLTVRHRCEYETTELTICHSVK
ncbi:hypothetical protein [Frigoriglobus tundricola]|uniref:Uncharacterized protein n=1 Tax=Frigoriglobus tundricola TaxID=2774151 RepID=A0A6M5YN24_9BACT|nr:hypothetical protein [Frigoriglobus tundricola]QJW94770.1 hypothetical protein FTUN_2293 [Frigoriglobus tundricola]